MVALSSGEAEFYAMIEGVTRAKGLISLSKDLGVFGVPSVIKLGTDSSAAKSFVSRRGLGKMRHLEIRNLWLQKEVADGNVIIMGSRSACEEASGGAPSHAARVPPQRTPALRRGRDLSSDTLLS